jgi:hypothetical protein
VFGAKTRALTTSNRVFPPSDGSLLNLTTAAFADRSGTGRDWLIAYDIHNNDTPTAAPSQK